MPLIIYDSQVTVNETVMEQGMAADTAYVGCLIRDLVNPRHASFAPVVAFCMVPYLSLFAHESYRKLELSDPALAASLSSDVRSIVARSRHSLKLFENTHRGIDGQLTFFREEILSAHSDHFLGRTWLPLLRFMEKDLGIYTYASRLITTTHGATFHVGVDAPALLAKTGEEVQSIYEEYGRYFARLGARLDAGEETFVSRLDPRRFNQHPIDVRASEYYCRVFDGPSNPDLNALLTVFRGMLHFVNSVIIAGRDDRTDGYTVSKVRFLTLYQILGSLRVLHDERLRDLSSRSSGYIDKILQNRETKLIMAPIARPFRNTLMHYDLDRRVDATRIDMHQPLFGLVPIYFPSYDASTFSSVVNRCIAETAAAIEEWADA